MISHPKMERSIKYECTFSYQFKVETFWFALMARFLFVFQTTSTFVDAWQVADSRCENEIPNDQEMELVCTDQIKSAANETCNQLLSNGKFSACLAVCIRFN